jgi:hypothetical protein
VIVLEDEASFRQTPTLHVYAQARMQDKRRAQLRVVKGLRRPGKSKKPVGGMAKTPKLAVVKTA